MKGQDQKKLAKWLDHLQQESWQLELLVSGFAIFLMIGAKDSIRELIEETSLQIDGLPLEGAILSIFLVVIYGASYFLLVNLILHVFLRGIWISAIGLRYISGDIDFEMMGLTEKFNQFLRSRIPGFDDYILKLENICSIVFAFTFLIVFMLLSVGMYIIVLAAGIGIGNWLLNLIFPELVSKIIIIPFALAYLIGGVLYFLDYITLGFIKRMKKFSRFYFPVYRFMSAITLSFLYRPLYYNLIDNKFGRKAGFLLVPYVVLITFIRSGQIESYLWFPDEPKETMLHKNYYDDKRDPDNMVVEGSIPSKYLDHGYLELFIRYKPNLMDGVLKTICPDRIPNKKGGFSSGIQFNLDLFSDEKQHEMPPDSILSCFAQIYQISIADSIIQPSDFFFYRHQNRDELGVMSVLDLGYLPRGSYAVQVSRLTITDGVQAWMPFFEIPFWKE